MNMKRVMIVGQPGSGKSTFARELGDRTGLPVIHIDKIQWMPGWTPRPVGDKTRLCRNVHAKERWIFEGGHSTTWQERFDRCDTFIWLDVALTIRLWRVMTRTIRNYGQTRPDMAEGCPERLELDFFRFIWSTRKSAREKMRNIYESAPAGKRVYRLGSNVENNLFLQKCTMDTCKRS